MNCKEYQSLLPQEKTEYIGKLLHSVQSDSKLFEVGQRIIKAATKAKLFEGVEIAAPDWEFTPPDETILNEQNQTD